MTQRILRCVMWLSLVLIVLSGAPLNAQKSDGLLEAQCEGTIGTTSAGMTILVDRQKITGGHYFLARALQDIPITGTIRDGRITLSASDGSTFELRFNGNGSENGEPLDFDNSVGLVGTRRKNGKIEKAELGFLTMGAPLDGRRYAFTTALSDAAFESIIREWRAAVLAGNRRITVQYTHFPLRVNAHKRHIAIRTPEELFKRWNRIFTSAYLARIRRDLPHDMLGGNSSLLVSLGNGDVWFGDKGIEILNLPD